MKTHEPKFIRVRFECRSGMKDEVPMKTFEALNENLSQLLFVALSHREPEADVFTNTNKEKMHTGLCLQTFMAIVNGQRW